MVEIFQLKVLAKIASTLRNKCTQQKPLVDTNRAKYDG